MKSLTGRQVVMMFCLSVISLKFLFFPAIVARYALNDTYISVFFGLMIDLAIIVLICVVIKKNPNLSFKQLLIENLGKVVFYLVYSVMLVYVLFKALLAIKEVHHYFLEFLYDDFSWLWFMLPIMLLLGYISAKSLRSMGRTVELLFVFIAIGVLITVVIPIKDIHLEYLSPFFSNTKGIFEGLFHTVFVYADWIIIVLVMGDFNVNKNTSRNILIFTIGTYIFVTLFLIIYVALFRNIGVFKPYAFSALPLYTDLPGNSGRLDWLSSIIWTFTLILQSGIMVAMASHILRQMFPKIKPVACSVVCVGFLISGMMVFYLNLSRLIKLIISTPFNIVVICVQALIPLLIILCLIIRSIKHKGGGKCLQNSKK